MARIGGRKPYKSDRWQPVPGQLATYVGRSSRLLKGGHHLRVIAEARAGRLLVEAIGHAGLPVRFTVAAANVGRPQPQLFDT